MSSEIVINDCWNKIGVWGEGDCPELAKVVHCRNCSVYSAAAVQMLDRDLPGKYLIEGAAHFAREKQLDAVDTQSVIVFRIAAEWLALPTQVFKEVSELRTIHSLPHRRSGIVLGLVNIRGELLVCVSLGEALGLEKIPSPKPDARRGAGRLLVVSREGNRLVFPVDEIHGVHRFHEGEVKIPPATVARAPATYIKGALAWQDKTVGCLDDQLLFYTLNRSLA